MPLVNTHDRTIEVKIVYYGPGLSGKTTNLRKLKELLAAERTGELMVLDTHGDRTLFFDWMPVDLGKVRGFDVRIQLYTVPGQVKYNNTRKQVLKGVDGIVFVADSQRAAAEQNEFSYENLKENLLEVTGKDIEEYPLVIQCNKQDLPNVMAPREIARLLGAEHRPHIKAIASEGVGVLETLRLISRLTLEHLREIFDPDKAKEHEASQQGTYDGDELLAEILSSGHPLEDEDTHPVEEVEVEAIPAGEPIEEEGRKGMESGGSEEKEEELERISKLEVNQDEEEQPDILERIEMLQHRLEELDVQAVPGDVAERLERLEKRMDVLDGEWADGVARRVSDLEEKLVKMAQLLEEVVKLLRK